MFYIFLHSVFVLNIKVFCITNFSFSDVDSSHMIIVVFEWLLLFILIFMIQCVLRKVLAMPDLTEGILWRPFVAVEFDVISFFFNLSSLKSSSFFNMFCHNRRIFHESFTQMRSNFYSLLFSFSSIHVRRRKTQADAKAREYLRQLLYELLFFVLLMRKRNFTYKKKKIRINYYLILC